MLFVDAVSKKMVKKKKMQKQLILERDVLLHLDHPLIVDLFWTFHDDTYFYFIQEFCSGGDLMNALIERETLSETLTKRYISELAMAINAVHEAGYIHRDIKPENVLLTASGHIKLCDFGSAARFEGKCLFEILGTPDFVATEMLERRGYGPKWIGGHWELYCFNVSVDIHLLQRGIRNKHLGIFLNPHSAMINIITALSIQALGVMRRN